jgi:hypothetical protein
MSWRAVVGLFAIVLGGLVLAYFSVGYGDREDWAICTQRYSAAHTAAESTRVDHMRAGKERGRGSARPIPTCGQLRSARAHGWIR